MIRIIAAYLRSFLEVLSASRTLPVPVVVRPKFYRRRRSF
jgi:hypothetical protein